MTWLKSTKGTAAPSVPAGQIVYAIGDIHGRADLLQTIVHCLHEEIETSSNDQVIVVGLGDYVDRGPFSRSVVSALIDMTTDARLECHFLCGNHEQVLLTFLEDATAGPMWTQFGGAQTLKSYNVGVPEDPADRSAWEEARQRFSAALPADHLRFFTDLKPYRIIGDYFFVHAGLRPGVPVSKQTERDMLWIRDPFLQSKKAFPQVVVHGHSITSEPYIDARRIGLDTAAHQTDCLTALRLEGTSKLLLNTVRRGARYELEFSIAEPSRA